MTDLNTWPSLEGLTEIPFSDIPVGELVVVVYDHSEDPGAVPYKSIIMFHKRDPQSTMNWYADPAAGGTCYTATTAYPGTTTTAQLPTITEPPHTTPELGYGNVRHTGERVCVTRYRDGYLEHGDGTRVHALGDILDFHPIPAYTGNDKRAAAGLR